MEYDDYFTNDNDDVYSESNQILKNIVKKDRGYNKIWRYFPNKYGQIKRKSVVVYTSGGVDSNIRDAESGQYYSFKVGSGDENLFFSVILATGECKSENNSSILFYTSPKKYMEHQSVELSPKQISNWEEKKYNYLKKLENVKKQKVVSTII